MIYTHIAGSNISNNNLIKLKVLTNLSFVISIYFRYLNKNMYINYYVYQSIDF